MGPGSGLSPLLPGTLGDSTVTVMSGKPVTPGPPWTGAWGQAPGARTALPKRARGAAGVAAFPAPAKAILIECPSRQRAPPQTPCRPFLAHTPPHASRGPCGRSMCHGSALRSAWARFALADQGRQGPASGAGGSFATGIGGCLTGVHPNLEFAAEPCARSICGSWAVTWH